MLLLHTTLNQVNAIMQASIADLCDWDLHRFICLVLLFERIISV